jgi:hypothetical protein
LRPSTLIGDSDDAAVIWLEMVRTPSNPFSPCDIEVGVDLLRPQRGAGRLDLDQARPHPLPAAAHDRPVGNDRLALRVLEADLGERLDDRRLGRTKLLEQRVAELRHGPHHSEQRRGRALLLLLLAADPGGRDQSSERPAGRVEPRGPVLP